KPPTAAARVPEANTDPVTDAAAVVHEVRARAAAAGLCDVFPVGAITRGLAGEEMSEIGELYEAGVRVLSDDGRVVPSARVLRNALTYARAFPGLVIAEHADDPTLAEGGLVHEGVVSYSLGLAGVPREAEEIVVARDIALARLTGGRIHFCHLSSAGSVELVRRAKAEGLAVTAEVTPHHLALTHDALATYDTSLRVNPPIRAAEDREALRAGLADGTIDVVATDHAPHAPEEKEVEFDQAPPGTIGLETALAVVLTDLVAPGLLDLRRAIEALSTSPARILGANGHGGPIASGAPANLVLFDPEATWTVAPPYASRSRNSAFAGRELRGRVVATFLRGEAVVLEGRARR
ncbi:MAG: dihydroorotase, partial [Actinomycetota bacterium]